MIVALYGGVLQLLQQESWDSVARDVDS